MSKNFYKNSNLFDKYYIEKQVKAIFSSIPGRHSEDRVSCLKYHWDRSRGLDYAARDLFEEDSFIRVVEDDRSFIAVFNETGGFDKSYKFYLDIHDDTECALLPYAELKAFLRFKYLTQVTSLQKREHFVFLSNTKNSVDFWSYGKALRDNDKENSSFRNKDTPIFRIVKNLSFDRYETPHEYFSNDWSTFVDQKTQELVAEWFENNKHVRPSIFAIYYVTEVFIKPTVDLEKLELLASNPIEWIEELDY